MKQKFLKSILHYNKASGFFTWIAAPRRGRSYVGKRAGVIGNHGYLVIGISGKTYLAHRLAWLYVTGEFPKNQVDHKNRKRTDNRWLNLREASYGENLANSKIKSGKKINKSSLLLDNLTS